MLELQRKLKGDLGRTPLWRKIPLILYLITAGRFFVLLAGTKRIELVLTQ